MTLNIRSAHKKHTEKKNTVTAEAAIKWVEENVVLINERIDRNTIENLTNKIVKFDETFGKYKDKIPSLAAKIQEAEAELEGVVTGKINEKKATDMLKKLSFMYSTFSSFFGKDLKTILMTPMFRGAKENADVKLNVLQAPAHNPESIRDAFVHALTPSRGDIMLLKKIYRGDIPAIDSLSISTQMLNLSYSELQELTNVNKIPMMATEEGMGSPPPAAPTPAPASTPVPAPAPATQMESVKKKENEQLLTEKINAKNAQALVNVIAQINQTANIPGMEKQNLAMQKLTKQAKKELADNTWMQGTSVKQLIMFYNVLESIKEGWGQVESLFSDGVIDAQDQGTLRKMLKKAASQGPWAFLKNLGTSHYPGLDPNSMSEAIVKAAGSGPEGAANISKFFEGIQKVPAASKTGEPMGGTPSSATAPSTQAAPTTQTGTASPSKPSGAPPATGQVQAATTPAAPAAAQGLPSTDEDINTYTKAIQGLPETDQDLVKLSSMTGKNPAEMKDLLVQLKSAGFSLKRENA